MHVVLLYNQVSCTPTSDELDVPRQCDAVELALCAAGHSATRLACGLNLADVRSRLLELQPDAVFNLVESLAGTDRLMPLPALLLEAMRIPFTGACGHAILTTSDKLLAKRGLCAGGLPTPGWISAAGCGDRPLLTGQVIFKAVHEHASFGIDDESVQGFSAGQEPDIIEQLQMRQTRTGTPYFAEQFIPGREFNLTILDGPCGPQVLPPAEIQFLDFPPHRPQIVGYAAKWDEAAEEYHNTPRTFDFSADDAALLNQLSLLAVNCWHRFGLGGYARIDFRVDHLGHPWVLEINANPCLSPDAGLAAAVARAGIPWSLAVQRILTAALQTSAQARQSPVPLPVSLRTGQKIS